MFCSVVTSILVMIFLQDDVNGPCNEQYLIERDSVPDNVKLFRSLLDE